MAKLNLDPLVIYVLGNYAELYREEMDSVIVQGLDILRNVITTRDLDDYLAMYGYENADTHNRLHSLSLSELYLVDLLLTCLQNVEPEIELRPTLLHLTKIRETGAIATLDNFLGRFGMKLKNGGLDTVGTSKWEIAENLKVA